MINIKRSNSVFPPPKFIKGNYNDIKLNVVTYNLTKFYLKTMDFLFEKHTNKFYRKQMMLDNIWINQNNLDWYCNSCGKLVFKGSIKYGIIMNCPYCHSRYQVRIDDIPNKETHNLMRTTWGNTLDVDEDYIIINGVRYEVKLFGKTFEIRD